MIITIPSPLGWVPDAESVIALAAEISNWRRQGKTDKWITEWLLLPPAKRHELIAAAFDYVNTGKLPVDPSAPSTTWLTPKRIAIGGAVVAVTTAIVLTVVLTRKRASKGIAGADSKSGRKALETPVDVDEAGDKFLSLLAPEKRPRAERALAIVLPAYKAGTIFNVDYEDAKNILNRLVDDAYEQHIQKPFLWGKGYTEVSALDSKIGSVSGLHQVISVAKKVDKLKPPGAYGDAQRAFAEAALPMALIVADLKSKVVKGRKPPDPEVAARRAEVEARKNIQTCSVCFRGIATLSNGLIADHGYRLPHRWQKTASCPGGMFRPLEVSSDGLAYMVKGLSAQVPALTKLIVQAPRLPSLVVDTGRSWDKQQRTITPDDPAWTKALQNHIGTLSRDLQETKTALVDYQRRLDTWRPGPQS